MLTLYYSPGACSLACHIVLEEIGAPYELALVSAMDGGTRSPEHLARNPKGRVPVLAIGDQVLTESVAILTYLAAAYPQAHLLPRDALAQARVYEWLNYLSGHVHAATFRQVTRPQNFTSDEAGHESVRQSGRRQVGEAIGFINGQLAGKHWAIGADYTIADTMLVTVFRWFIRNGFDLIALAPNWSAHTQRMSERAAVQRALAQEGLELWR